MKPADFIFQDWRANAASAKGRLVLVFFRAVQLLSRSPWPIPLLALPVFILYRVIVEWFLGIELRRTTSVGPGLALHHGQGLVVNDRTIIGAGCVLRQNTTIGNKQPGGGCPVIGDRVDIGANCVVIGEIRVGDGAVIGAGSVVVKDIPAGAVAAGNPAQVIRNRE